MTAELRNQILQYAVKLPDAARFLGMPKRKHWILYGQELDPFGLKNWLGFNLSRGTGEYASSTQFAEVRHISETLSFIRHLVQFIMINLQRCLTLQLLQYRRCAVLHCCRCMWNYFRCGIYCGYKFCKLDASDCKHILYWCHELWCQCSSLSLMMRQH